MKLKEREHIVTAFANSAAGPGWANAPLWVIVRGADGNLREECLQPNEQTSDMRVLYAVSQSTHEAMTAAVMRTVRKVKLNASDKRRPREGASNG